MKYCALGRVSDVTVASLQP